MKIAQRTTYKVHSCKCTACGKEMILSVFPEHMEDCSGSTSCEVIYPDEARTIESRHKPLDLIDGRLFCPKCGRRQCDLVSESEYDNRDVWECPFDGTVFNTSHGIKSEPDFGIDT